MQVATTALMCITWICDAEQLYTDAALVLDASTRVAAAAGSGLIDLHLHGVVDHPDETGWVASTALMTLRASRGSVMLSSYTQAQRSC